MKILPSMLVLLLAASLSTAAVADQPNFILIVTDDQEIGTFDIMPLVRRNVQERGLTYRQAFVSLSWCCPARATILRGQYAHNHDVKFNLPPFGFERFHKLGLEESTIATWLQDAGYRTFFAGKYLNGYPGDDRRYFPPGWNQWYGWLDGHYFNYKVNHNGELIEFADAESDYETDVMAAFAEEFIRDAPEDGRPFFAYLAPFAPHSHQGGLAIPAPRHATSLPKCRAPRTKAFNESNVSDKPPISASKKKFSKEEIRWIDKTTCARKRSLLAVDEMVGRLVAALEDTKMLDNTYVIFSSDNGWHQGEHRLPPGKTTPYEVDIRVPFVVRGPGIPEGEQRDAIVVNHDIAPTLADLAGVTIPDFVDGRSIVPTFAKDPDAWRKAFLLELWTRRTNNHKALKLRFRGIWTRDRKLVLWGENEAEVECYLLHRDPQELKNQCQDGKVEAAFQDLDVWLDELERCSGQGCRDLEDFPPPPAADRSPAGLPIPVSSPSKPGSKGAPP